MKKTPINSFWVTDKAPLDDLAKIQEYLKPRGPSELLGLLAPLPPLPPSAEVRVEEPERHPQDPLSSELMDMYGITPEEFVASAVREPELWDEDELERLLGVLSGDLPPQAVADIAFEHMRTGGVRRPKPQPPVHQPVDEDELDFGEPERLEVVPQPMPGPPLEVPGTVDVGEWWAKKSKS